MDGPRAFPELSQRLYEAREYRVTALRELPRRSRVRHLVKVGHPVRLPREQLESEAGSLELSAFLHDLFTDEDLYVEAVFDREWVTASWWRMVETFRDGGGEGGGGPPLDLRLLAGELKRIRAETPARKPELGETACHLIDHLGLAWSQAQEVAKLAGFKMYPSQWSQAVRNGRKRYKRLRRLKRDRPCRYCQ